MNTEQNDQETLPPPATPVVDDMPLKSPNNFFLSLMLFLSGVGLGGTAIATAAVIMGARDAGIAAVGMFGALIYFGQPVCLGSIALLVIYAAITKPWRAGSRAGKPFWIQTPLALIAALMIGWMQYGQHQIDQEDARDEARKVQVTEDQQQMAIAVLTDDSDTFTKAFDNCGDSCYRSSWVSQAVLANAPHTLAVLLKGATPATYDNEIASISQPSFCVRQTYYIFTWSLARLVGLRNEPAITQQFQPLWTKGNRDSAFSGAVMGGHLDQMDAMVKLGVNPKDITGEFNGDSLYATAAAGGVASPIAWLAKAGVVVPTKDSAEYVWHSLAEWANYTRPEIAQKAIAEWMKESRNIRYAPGAKLSNGEALFVAVHYNSPMLVQAMVDRGYKPDFDPEMDDRYRHRIQQMLARAPTDQSEQNERHQMCDGGEREWTSPDVPRGSN
ncbi:hypothetical protein [Paraburkholderia sp. C35]|uniref:hypothetical protein n=1 Tax=Paraburkholderia sp. C35 TaxID=2126993 RepID=UPI000D699159|nr:hypothetical protein [Paraburkholderia sp. C35]